MTRKCRIIIVEGHALLRAGLHALVTAEADMKIVAESDDAGRAYDMLAELCPDLVVMDIGMPATSGLEIIANIRQNYPVTRILVITSQKSDDCIREALRAGALGYVLKSASQDELLLAIRSVAIGKLYLSPDISQRVVSGYLGMGHTPADLLTKREREVLTLVAQGSGNRHIAGQLQLSIKTVEKHRSNLMRKLGMRNASMLTAYAIDRGLVNLET